MAVKSYTYDSRGRGNGLSVNKDGAMETVLHGYPIKSENVQMLPFAQYFTDTGDASGSNNMAIDGSAGAVFYIKASAEYDIYIGSIAIQISDPGARLDRFGALPELANGVSFYYEEPQTGRIVIEQAMKTNIDLFFIATGGKEHGTATDAYKADISGGAGLDTYFPEIDMADRFKLPYGVLLPRASNAIIALGLNDNLSGLSIFKAKGFCSIVKET